MYVYGLDPAPLVIATDWRSRSDADLDIAEPEGRPHVLHMWRLGAEALGARRYTRANRTALFDHGDIPPRASVTDARETFAWWIKKQRPERVIIIPTPSAQLGEGVSAIGGTACWTALHPPDSLEAMRLTFWRYNAHTEVMVGFPIARRAKQVQLWAMAQAMRRAATEKTLECSELRTEMSELSACVLYNMRDKPLAVDLEFVPGRNIVTAIGLSDGMRAVSIPWHSYVPRGHEERELGIADYPHDPAAYIVDELKNLLRAATPKYCHNFVADVPLLRRLELEVGGPVCDTFAAHAIAFPELRHGLQAAAASLLPVPPWKSLYRPSDLRGLGRDDEEFWIADPKALRDYNAKDAFYTWHLAQRVLPLVGCDPTTGDMP